MSKADKLLKSIANNPKDVKFSDLIKICEKYFGDPRINGSHHFFETPWHGDPIVNIQKAKGGKAKGYQVKLVLEALKKLGSV